MTMKIMTAEQMRRADEACIAGGTPGNVLMERAGKAAAEETRAHLGTLEDQHILCLVGAGNNGGDGLVVARYLHEWGATVDVYLCSGRLEDDSNLKLVRERGIACTEAAKDTNLETFDELLATATCAVDALLGIGRMRPLEGFFKQVLERVNEAKRSRNISIIAIDLPSGLDADTGAADPACPVADITVTFAFPKLGLYSFPGAERAGTVKVADIGIPESPPDSVKTELMTDELARDILPERPLNANKGTFGRVMVTAGSINYIGAAYLACSGALRVGAGLVTLATAGSLQPVLAAKLTETTYLPLEESTPGAIGGNAAETIAAQCSGYTALLAGCGLGQAPSTADFVRQLLAKTGLPATVLDADALNILAATSGWQKQLPGDAILTPHPGEMSRLCGLSIPDIQADRFGAAVKYAAEWNKTVVLKGAYAIIAAPDGRCRVSPFANPGLASAGTGDVLAGAIAGLTAQGLPLFDAASLGVYLHASAGEMIKTILGDTGMTASDLLPALPAVIKQLISKK